MVRPVVRRSRGAAYPSHTTTLYVDVVFGAWLEGGERYQSQGQGCSLEVETDNSPPVHCKRDGVEGDTVEGGRESGRRKRWGKTEGDTHARTMHHVTEERHHAVGHTTCCFECGAG